MIVFATKPLLEQRGPLKPTLRINITSPDRRELGGFLIHPPKVFSAATEGCDVRIDRSWVRGNLQHYELHAEQASVQGRALFEIMLLR